MVFGKIIGAALGWTAGGVFGLLLGFFIGQAFDRGLGKALRFGSPVNIERIKTSFFETTFLLSGYLAKADGRISQSEVNHTEQLIVQLGLDAQQRARAIELFRQGATPDFQLEPVTAAFLQACGPQPQLQKTLLLFLISLAHADEELASVEHAALVRIATQIGLGAAQLEQLLRMAQAQDHFQSGGSDGGSAGYSVDQAYKALGVDSGLDDKGVKRAYRKLMSENHPDKLMAKGVPDNMVKLATERSQEIQAAYETVRKHRGFKK